MVDALGTARKRCLGVKVNGEACGSVVVDPRSGLCIAHDPAREDQRREARIRGGRHSSIEVRLRRSVAVSPDVLGVLETLTDTVSGVRDGSIPPAVGNSVASLARAMLGALESERTEVRLRGLEDLLEQLGRGSGVLADDVGGSA